MSLIGILLSFLGAVVEVGAGLVSSLVRWVVGALIPVSPFLLFAVGLIWLVRKPQKGDGIRPSPR